MPPQTQTPTSNPQSHLNWHTFGIVWKRLWYHDRDQLQFVKFYPSFALDEAQVFKCLLLILGILAPCSSNPQNFAHSRPAWEGGTLMTYMMYQTWNHKCIQLVNACVWFVHAIDMSWYWDTTQSALHSVHCTLLHKKSSSTCLEYLHPSQIELAADWDTFVCLCYFTHHYIAQNLFNCSLIKRFLSSSNNMRRQRKGCPVSDFKADLLNSNTDFCFWYRTYMIGIGF